MRLSEVVVVLHFVLLGALAGLALLSTDGAGDLIHFVRLALHLAAFALLAVQHLQHMIQCIACTFII
jgi:TRAP-type mannitol/chloroaromatic compound transport system permease small subunit